MLIVSLDLETLGLLHETPLPEITCVCMHTSKGDNITLRMWINPDLDILKGTPIFTLEQRADNQKCIIDLLDVCDRIVGYNILGFDLEFLRRAFDIDDMHMMQWVMKCIDPLVCLRDIVGQGCKLQDLLEWNALGSKTADGEEAISMAQKGEWKRLMDYCLLDAQLTYALCALEWIQIGYWIECHLNWGQSPPLFRMKTMPLCKLSTLCMEEKHYTFEEAVSIMHEVQQVQTLQKVEYFES